jgi:microsomal epoxide hydrolase
MGRRVAGNLHVGLGNEVSISGRLIEAFEAGSVRLRPIGGSNLSSPTTSTCWLPTSNQKRTVSQAALNSISTPATPIFRTRDRMAESQPRPREGSSMIATFEIPFSSEVVDDLKRRLGLTRWTDSVTADWTYGTNEGFLRELIDYWAQTYDWAARRSELNRLPHFRAVIDGYGVHFLHFRGRGATSVPLLLMNGWPSSFVEFQRLAPLLVEGEPSFDVVIPALPGFGFSDRPTRPYQIEPEEVFSRLMAALGYGRFMAAGTDIGSGVATRTALRHPDRVVAAHVSLVTPKPIGSDAPPLTPAELDYQARVGAWMREEGGYQAIQNSRPQTLAYGLADSPAGLASWIVEKFRAWSDCGGDVAAVFPFETLVDNLMVYWTTNTIGSSVRYYYEAVRMRPPIKVDDFVRVPTAVAMWPHDIALTPREAAERLYNVRRYTVFPRGGHFPAWEAPDLYADNLRQFAGEFAA